MKGQPTLGPGCVGARSHNGASVLSPCQGATEFGLALVLPPLGTIAARLGCLLTFFADGRGDA